MCGRSVHILVSGQNFRRLWNVLLKLKLSNANNRLTQQSKLSGNYTYHILLLKKNLRILPTERIYVFVFFTTSSPCFCVWS